MTTEQIKEFVRKHEFNTAISVVTQDFDVTGTLVGYTADGLTINMAWDDDWFIRYDDIASVE